MFTDVEAAKESMISTKFRLYESNSKTCGHEGSRRVNQWRDIGVSQEIVTTSCIYSSPTK